MHQTQVLQSGGLVAPVVEALADVGLVVLRVLGLVAVANLGVGAVVVLVEPLVAAGADHDRPVGPPDFNGVKLISMFSIQYRSLTFL